MTGKRSPQRAVLGAALSLLLSGCGGVERQLASRYAAEFACPNPEVMESPGRGFRVEGCNQVAFYYCDHERCRLEHSRELTEQERSAAAERHQRAQPGRAQPDEHTILLAQQLAAARARLASHPDEPQHLGQVEADTSRIELASLPGHDAVMVMRFSTQNELTPGACRPTISIANHVVSNELVGPQSTHEATLLLEAEPLRRMDEAQPVRGVVCGVSFSLDESARRQLAGLLGKQAAPLSH